MPIVTDASVTLPWCLKDERSTYADRVLDVVVADAAIVPGLWLLEMANGLLVAERRGRITRAELVEVEGMLLDLSISTNELTLEHALQVVVNLAREQGLTAYDASYLDLAMREGLPLATQDDDLRAAAARVGVPLID